MDFDIEKAKELIAKREAIDIGAARATIARFDEIGSELAKLVSGDTAATPTTRKPQKCGNCGKEGHSARSCPDAQVKQS